MVNVDPLLAMWPDFDDDDFEDSGDDDLLPEEFLRGLDEEDVFLDDVEEEFQEDFNESIQGAYRVTKPNRPAYVVDEDDVEYFPATIEYPHEDSDSNRWKQYYTQKISELYSQHQNLKGDVRHLKEVADCQEEQNRQLERLCNALDGNEHMTRSEMQELTELALQTKDHYLHDTFQRCDAVQEKIDEAHAVSEQLNEQLLGLQAMVELSAGQMDTKRVHMTQIQEEVNRNQTKINELNRVMAIEVQNMEQHYNVLEEKRAQLQEAAVQHAGMLFDNTLQNKYLAALSQHALKLQQECEDEKSSLQVQVAIRKEQLQQVSAADKRLMQEVENRKRMISALQGHLSIMEIPQNERWAIPVRKESRKPRQTEPIELPSAIQPPPVSPPPTQNSGASSVEASTPRPQNRSGNVSRIPTRTPRAISTSAGSRRSHRGPTQSRRPRWN